MMAKGLQLQSTQTNGNHDSRSSTDKDKPVKVAVDVEFYDGMVINLIYPTQCHCRLNSLNHWTGASYVDSGDELVFTVEAKDKDGNTVRGIGIHMQMVHP